MDTLPLRELTPEAFPPLLAEIPQPPKSLWAVGTLPSPRLPLLAVVGSRRYTSYGRQVVEHLIDGLSSYEVGIVSGLALGIDALAHEAALKAKLYTLAVPGSGLSDSVIYPRSNRNLARRIVETGGGLLSELPPDHPAALWTFPQRNRIMAGMTHATLLIEADEKSGTLITARMAVDYNRELLVIPGSIFSATSRGTHQFLKLGATPITSIEDIVLALNLNQKPNTEHVDTTPSILSPEATKILHLLREPTDRDTLIRQSGLEITHASALLTELELTGHISFAGGVYTALTHLPE